MNRFYILCAALWSGVSAQAGTLEDVKSRGELACGVNTGLVGFADQNDSGEWAGFDVSLCRAVAAAVLGDATAVRFVPTTTSNRFDLLNAGSVDLLARNTTWDFSADVAQGGEFAGIHFYDGQGFLVPKALGVSSAKELDGQTICTQSDPQVLDGFFSRHNMTHTTIRVDTPEAAAAHYLDGDCSVYTADASHLAALRATFASPLDHALLPEIISKEPLGPVVRQDDPQWGDLIRWVLNALIAAEELGITSAIVNELQPSAAAPEVARLLGADKDLGKAFDLDGSWATRAIAAVGNYGEIFAKTIGENTAIGLPRGLNAQWSDGGLLYALPFR
jgi:general L-amino acid transport system substrate-binding protein